MTYVIEVRYAKNIWFDLNAICKQYLNEKYLQSENFNNYILE